MGVEPPLNNEVASGDVKGAAEEAAEMTLPDQHTMFACPRCAGRGQLAVCPCPASAAIPGTLGGQIAPSTASPSWSSAHSASSSPSCAKRDWFYMGEAEGLAACDSRQSRLERFFRPLSRQQHLERCNGQRAGAPFADTADLHDALQCGSARGARTVVPLAAVDTDEAARMATMMAVAPKLGGSDVEAGAAVAARHQVN